MTQKQFDTQIRKLAQLDRRIVELFQGTPDRVGHVIDLVDNALVSTEPLLLKAPKPHTKTS